MKTALITGFNARTGSKRRAERDITFAALLSAALIDNGWHVEHRDPALTEDIENRYDKVFVGLASPVALSSSRTYVGLAAIARSWRADKCVFFLDDPDITKVVNGLDSVARKPERLSTSFYSARAGYDLVQEPRVRDWLLRTIESLRTNEWPLLLVPTMGSPDVGFLLAYLRSEMKMNAIGCDLTAYIPELALPAVTRDDYWTSIEAFNDPWFSRMEHSWPVKHLGKMRDSKRIGEYARAAGVLEKPMSRYGAGWLTPNIAYAVQAGSIYVTDWKAVSHLGGSFNYLPCVIEEATDAQREEIAHTQAKDLSEAIWNPLQITEFIERNLL